MSEQEYAKIISKNLRRIMYEHGKTQADVAKDLKISKATLSSWMNGTRIPRMPNVDMLCHYFNITRVELMEEHDEVSKTRHDEEYYEDARLAQEMFEDPDMRSLFHMKKNMDPKKFQAHMTYMRNMYRLEHPEDEWSD